MNSQARAAAESASMTALEKTLFFSLAAVYIAEQLTRWEPLTPILGSLALVTLAVMLPQLKGVMFWLTALFTVGGAAVMLGTRSEAALWFEAASINVTLVTLFVFVPLFGIPVRMPAYMEALKRFYETNTLRLTGMFTGTQVLTQIMSVFINVGALPVMYQLASVHPRLAATPQLPNALGRGYAGAIFWSPYFASMALVTSGLSLSWSSMLPYLLCMAAVSVLASLAVDYRGLAGAERALAGVESGEKGARSPFPRELILYLAGAMVVIVLLERWIDWPMVLITCLAAAVFPLGWCLARGGTKTYLHGLRQHVNVTLPNLKKEMTLFLSAGFFSGAIGAVGFGDALLRLLERMPFSPAFNLSLFIVALVVVTSLFGLHPLVLMTILVNSVDPAAVGMSAVAYGVLLLGTWGFSNTISPSTAVNNLLSGLFRKPVLDIARMNYGYAGIMAAALLVFMSFVLI